MTRQYVIKHKPWMDSLRVCPTCGVEFYPHQSNQRFHDTRCAYIHEKKNACIFGRKLTMPQAIEYYGHSYDAWKGQPRRHARYMEFGQRHPGNGEVKL